MTAQEHIAEGLPVSKVCQAAGIARSTLYYMPAGGRRGRQKTTVTYHENGTAVDNSIICYLIEWLINRDFNDYGYRMVAKWLQRLGFKINAKKVYRLMTEQRLLLSGRGRKKLNKNWVKELVPTVHVPFDHLEFDIKYFSVDGRGKNGMVLTIIDVLSRYNLGHYVAYRIGMQDVVDLFKRCLDGLPRPSIVTVRSDNGKQFESNILADLFDKNLIIHEFTYPATPEQNAHIESYHSILVRCFLRNTHFETLEAARKAFDRFRDYYNHERLHSGCNYRTPVEILADFEITVAKPAELILANIPDWRNLHNPSLS